MSLKFSYAINVILGFIVLYLLSNKETCPEVNVKKITEHTIVERKDTSTVHSGTALVVVKKGVAHVKGNGQLQPLAHQPDTAQQANANAAPSLCNDSISLTLRDSNVAIEVSMAGAVQGSPNISYKLLQPYRYDHYTNTTEYVSSEKWLRMYAGVGSIVTGNFDIGPSATFAMPRIAIDYTFLLKQKQHMIGLRARLFGR